MRLQWRIMNSSSTLGLSWPRVTQLRQRDSLYRVSSLAWNHNSSPSYACLSHKHSTKYLNMLCCQNDPHSPGVLISQELENRDVTKTLPSRIHWRTEVRWTTTSCYKCGKGYFSGHQCRPKNMMVVEELTCHEREGEASMENLAICEEDPQRDTIHSDHWMNHCW